MFQNIKSIARSAKHVQQEVKQLQGNLQKLSAASQTVTSFQHDVQRAVDRWQFKCQPRLDKISELMKDLNK